MLPLHSSRQVSSASITDTGKQGSISPQDASHERSNLGSMVIRRELGPVAQEDGRNARAHFHAVLGQARQGGRCDDQRAPLPPLCAPRSPAFACAAQLLAAGLCDTPFLACRSGHAHPANPSALVTHATLPGSARTGQCQGVPFLHTPRASSLSAHRGQVRGGRSRVGWERPATHATPSQGLAEERRKHSLAAGNTVHRLQATVCARLAPLAVQAAWLAR